MNAVMEPGWVILGAIVGVPTLGLAALYALQHIERVLAAAGAVVVVGILLALIRVALWGLGAS